MKALPLDKMPFSLAAFNEETRELTRDQRAIVLELRSYIWRLGFLPIEPRDVAEKVGLSERRWIRIAPAIAMHFDHDEDGRWRDLDLEKERDKHLDARQRMSAGGSAGIQKRWADYRAAKEAEHAAERQTRVEAYAHAAGELPDGFADTLGSGKDEPRVSVGYPGPTLSRPYADPSLDPLGSGVVTGGLTDRLGSLLKDGESPVSLSVLEPPVGRVGVGDRDPSDRVCRPDPSSTLADQATAEPPAAEMSNEAIEQLIIAEGGDGLVFNWPRGKTFKVLRAAIRGGTDLRLDYLPSLRDFVGGARKGARGRCEVPANPEIMAATFQRRDRRHMAPAAAAAPPIAVDVDLAENVEPLALYRAAAGKTYLNEKYRNGYKLADVDPVLWEQCRQRAGARPGAGMAAP